MEGVHERVVGSTSLLVPTDLVVVYLYVNAGGGMHRTGGLVNVLRVLSQGWFSSATTFSTPVWEVERWALVLRVTLSSTPLSNIGEDWLILDRVIDAPAHQVTLTWNGSSQASWGEVRNDLLVPIESQAPSRVIAVCEAMWITCRWPNLSAISHLRIRRSCCDRSI